jgi:hypothetical protein
MLTGEFRVDGGILCRRGNSVSTGEFRVDGIPLSMEFRCRRDSVVDGIPCRRNSVSTEFRVDGIPYRRNSVSTEFRGHPTLYLVEK